METESSPAPNHEEEPNVAAGTEPVVDSDESSAAADLVPAEEPPGPAEPGPDPAPARRRRVDQVALALLTGIVVLLLICVVIVLIAWRHAPVNPAMPAAHWHLLGPQFG